MAKSNKTILQLEEIVNSYCFVPPVNIYVCINGEANYLLKGVRVCLTQGQFETLLTSEYGKYIT